MAEFDAADIARGVGELYDPLADEKGVALKIDAAEAGAAARQPRAGHAGARQSGGQRHQVRRAARRWQPAERRPAIVVTARSEGDQVLLTVADNGPGIAEADRGRVVERFVRLEASRSEPGSGLGLSLVSAVAHLHGGELRLEDNAPGLRAVLALPRAGRQLPTPAD